jgi:hypothetical protein
MRFLIPVLCMGFLAAQESPMGMTPDGDQPSAQQAQQRRVPPSINFPAFPGVQTPGSRVTIINEREAVITIAVTNATQADDVIRDIHALAAQGWVIDRSDRIPGSTDVILLRAMARPIPVSRQSTQVVPMK